MSILLVDATKNMESYNIALIGCGTVGSGLARLPREPSARLDARARWPLVLRKVDVLDPAKRGDVALLNHLLTTDLREVLQDRSIQLAVEVVGGLDWAKRTFLDLLAAGKDVVTANKALLAEHGAEIFDAGRRHGRAIAFEASVAGGIPIIAALTQCLAANQIISLQGILNGTSNFILTGMSEAGRSYAEALKEPQGPGDSQAYPINDVDGTDPAQKLAILAQISIEVLVPMSTIHRRGITDIHQPDIRFAKE